MSAHDGGVEHLKEMRRGTHGCERVEERLEDASLAQPIEAFPHAVPMTKAIRQCAPANVFNGKEMKRLEEAAIVLGLPAAPGQQARNTASVCLQSSSSIFVDMDPGP
jgi:hypothetical protein